jgi:NAD(P)H-hydrate epimerase
MRLVGSVADVRELDRRMIEDLGIPGAALMETAARGVADAIVRHHAEAARDGVVVACGPGNNGGDGWATARWLHGWGFRVAVVEVGRPGKGSDAALHRRAARKAGVAVQDELGQAGLLVDAVFGTGLARPVSGKAAALLHALDTHGAPIVAVDVPSGLSADTGEVLGVCPRALRTVTFGRAKLGAFLRDGPDRCGLLDEVDLGFDAVPDASDLASAEIPTAADLSWPRRRPGDHKRDSGHLLVVAGSAAMAGAAILVCRAALAAGVGLVTLCAPNGARPRLAALPAEVMLLDGGDGDRLGSLPDELDRFDAFAVGPGLGGGAPVAAGLGRALATWWSKDRRPMVFDADALAFTGKPASAPRILTPHSGEAGRLLGSDAAAVDADRLSAAGSLTARGAVLLKGRCTVVAADGERPSLNPTGSPVLATGGTGDVLTGLLGALLARGLAARDAARVGAFVHGRAAERLALRGAEGWTATDVVREIPATVAATWS